MPSVAEAHHIHVFLETPEADCCDWCGERDDLICDECGKTACSECTAPAAMMEE